jgi:hypothetical protein
MLHFVLDPILQDYINSLTILKIQIGVQFNKKLCENITKNIAASPPINSHLAPWLSYGAELEETTKLKICVIANLVQSKICLLTGTFRLIFSNFYH